MAHSWESQTLTYEQARMLRDKAIDLTIRKEQEADLKAKKLVFTDCRFRLLKISIDFENVRQTVQLINLILSEYYLTNSDSSLGQALYEVEKLAITCHTIQDMVNIAKHLSFIDACYKFHSILYKGRLDMPEDFPTTLIACFYENKDLIILV